MAFTWQLRARWTMAASAWSNIHPNPSQSDAENHCWIKGMLTSCQTLCQPFCMPSSLLRIYLFSCYTLVYIPLAILLTLPPPYPSPSLDYRWNTCRAPASHSGPAVPLNREMETTSAWQATSLQKMQPCRRLSWGWSVGRVTSFPFLTWSSLIPILNLK